MIHVLPHLSGALNTVVVVLLLMAYAAIRRGDRTRHRRLMLSAIGTGVVFVGVYVAQTLTQGDKRFPGDDWLRTLFVVILISHTILAVVVVPMILRTAYLGLKDRLDRHRPLARITFPVWLYVATTGVVIYVMNNWVRPH